MESTMVIKVKHGDTLRRFNVDVDENEKLVLDIDGLRAKVQGLFNFPRDADLTLTYIDEDGDVVTLVDDDDLCDVMRQRLKFLRIDVQLNNYKFGKAYAGSSGSSTPLRTPRVQHPLPDINNTLSEILKSVPEPLRETLSKLSIDVATKAASSSTMLADLVDCFSKMGLSDLNLASHSQSDAESSRQAEASEGPKAPSVPKGPNATKDGGLKQELPKAADTTAYVTSKSNSREVDVGTAFRSVGAPVMHLSSAVDLNVVPPIDPIPSGITTVNLAPAACNIPAGDDRTDAKKDDCLLGGKSVNSLESTSAADSTMPSDVDQSRTMDLGGNPSNDCPVTGIPVANDSSVTVRSPRIRLIQQSINHDAMVGIFHKGIRCDGCGAHPITGSRFKSKVKDDYDLCSICFAATGNETDYIRIDRPVRYRHPQSFRGLYNHRQNFWPGAPVPPCIGAGLLRGCGIKPDRSKLDSCFILDVNVLDGTLMAPSTPFTKIWRMRNSGTLAWPQGTQLVWIGGDKISDTVAVEIEAPTDVVPVEGELDVAVDFTAPELPGHYISYWRMASPSGVKFGQRVWVLIQVDASLKDSICDSFGGLNLNLPPESNRSNSGLEIIDMNVQPSVDGGSQDPCNTHSVNEPVKLAGDKQPKKEPEMDFPINDSLLIGHGASASAPPPPPPTQTPPTVSYPIIDLTEAALDEPSHAPLPFTGMPTSSGEISDRDAVELTLLKELEVMGFKQVDLNKEILRMNEYDLEQSVDDLCGVADWDPILEELQEMGFCDEEMNKRLLKKNNGSIKRVVMDLLTGEKA